MLASVAALAAGGCGGKEKPSLTEAQPFADSFVRRLVVDGRWATVAEDASSQLSRDLRNFQRKIRSDGMRQVEGSGRLRHDCPLVPATGAGKDCFAYRLQGKQVIPFRGVVPLRADFRLWVSYEDGGWQVINYDYTLVPSSTA
jgi:hypothetical protein